MQSYRPVPMNFNDPTSLAFPPHPSSSRPPEPTFSSYSQNVITRNGPPTEIRNTYNQPYLIGYGNTQNDHPLMNQGNSVGNGMIFPFKNEVPLANNYVKSQQYTQKGTQEKKYTYRSSIEDNERFISDKNYEDMNDIRKEYRRSESVSKAKTQDYDKEISSKGYLTTNRLSSDAKEQELNKNKNNQYSNYNIQNYSFLQANDPSTSKTKEDKLNFPKYQEFSKYNPSSTYNPKQYNFKTYLEEIKSTPSTYTELPAQRKQSNQYERVVSKENKDLGKSEKMSEKSDFRKTLGKDIEILKNITKQSKEALDRELSKNTYLTKLLQKRASRNLEEAFKSEGLPSKNEAKNIIVTKEDFDSSKQTQQQIKKEKQVQFYKQLQITNEELRVKTIELQKSLEEKMKEGNDKNKQIWDKSKVLIEKNKNIQALRSQLRETKISIQTKESVWKEKQTFLEEKIIQLEQEIQLKNNKIDEVEKQTQEILSIAQKEKEEKSKKIQQCCSTIETMEATIGKLNKKIEELTNDKSKYAVKNEQLRESQSKSNIQLFQVKTQLVSRDKQILLLEEEIEQLKEQLKAKQQMIESKSLEEQTNNKPENIDNIQKQMKTELDDIANDLPEVSREDLERIISCFEAREKELTHLLLDGETEHDHDKIINRLKELLDVFKAAQKSKQAQKKKKEEKQLFKKQCEYLEKEYQVMNQQLKMVGNKLIQVSHETDKSWCLINQYNNQIILLNLTNLNLRYKEHFSEIDQEDVKLEPIDKSQPLENISEPQV